MRPWNNKNIYPYHSVWISSVHIVSFQTNQHSRHYGCNHCTGNKYEHISSIIPVIVQSIMKTVSFLSFFFFLFFEVLTYLKYTFLQIIGSLSHDGDMLMQAMVSRNPYEQVTSSQKKGTGISPILWICSWVMRILNES